MLSRINGKRRPADWLAVVFSADRVEVAQVDQGSGSRPAVTICDSYARGAVDVDTLRRLGKSLRVHRYRCSSLLRAGEYQMQLVEAPNVPAAEVKAAVRWKLKDLLDYPVDAATVDVVDVPSDGSGHGRAHYVYAVSARNDQIAKWQKLFHNACVDLDAIDVPEMAQRNVARLFEQPGRGLAMLVFDDDGGLLTFTSGGELYMARRTDITLAQLGAPAAETRQQALDRLVLELQRSLDHFDRQFPRLSVARLLLAPLPTGTGVQQYLADNLYLPVQTLDLNEVMDFPGAPQLREPERQGTRLHLIGAALRAEVAAS